MTKTCNICNKPIKDGQRVHAGVLTTFKEIPSRIAWALEKPTKYTFVHHATCEELE